MPDTEGGAGQTCILERSLWLQITLENGWERTGLEMGAPRGGDFGTQERDDGRVEKH